MRGAVVYVTLDHAELPRLEEALLVECNQPGPLMLEVQTHGYADQCAPSGRELGEFI